MMPGMAETITGIAGLKEREGKHLGYSDWLEITQERINQFAEATGDFQWIHVDPERAKDGPFGGTIAHGYLTLSHRPDARAPGDADATGFKMGVNYGCGKVRFPSPVPVGSKLRLGVELKSVKELAPGQAQAPTSTPSRSRVHRSPRCVAEVIVRMYE
jgi:acyl dehydratase